MKNEIIVNTQLAFFFESAIQRPDEFITSFNESMGKIFDEVPIILPVPDQAQLLGVPLVQMRSKNGIYSCNIARNRVDFFIAGEGKQKFADIENNLLEKTDLYYSFFASRAKIKRLGFVVRFFIQEENPDLAIANLINDDFKKNHDGETHQSYIRFITRTKIRGLKSNNYTTVEQTTANIDGVGTGVLGVLITRDFNTVPEDVSQEKIDSSLIKEFINEGKSKFNLEKIKESIWPI